MKSKKLLFAGIALLLIGILIKNLLVLNVLGLVFISIGVLCKTIYIVSKALSGEYKPGNELVYLALGLGLFFTGLYLKKLDDPLINPVYLLAVGGSLKVLFIILFIRSVKRTQQ